MATWGEPNRRSRRDGSESTRPPAASGRSKGTRAAGTPAAGKPAAGKSASPKSASPKSASPKSASPKSATSSARATAVETPPQGTARASGRAARRAGDDGAGDPSQTATTELRHAVAGREHEFLGIGLVVLGLVLGLAIYLDLAGPLGDGIETLVGLLAGVARYVIPPVLVLGGVAMVRRGRSGHPLRLVLGWTVTVFATLALLHVAGGPPDIVGNLGEVDEAGGLLGAALGAPLLGLLDTVATVVVLAALVLVGAMLISRASVRTMAGSAGRGLGGVLHSLRRAPASDDSTEGGDPGGSDPDGSDSGGSATPAALTPSPTVRPTAPYDLAADDDFAAEPEPAPRRQPAPKPARAPRTASADPGEQAELDLGPGAKKGKWVLPPMSTLGRSTAQAIDQREVDERGRALVHSLSTFGVETRLVGQTVGPTVTRYELEMGTGVKVARITSLNRDIAYAMAATDVRILAPIPGRSAIGVEVPNHTRQLVSLGDIMTAAESRAATHPLDVAIGKDIAGRAVFLNLATTPHLLIAGTTGAGKSSGINSILTSLLMRTTPEQVRLILIDPKQVEMGQYNRLPHLLTQPVTNPKKAANALAWAVKEMETRYDLLYETGFRDITGYNAAFDRGELQPEPGSDPDKTYRRLEYIVVVVDELNDLMMVAKRDVEDSITRIAQKARAVGVHLIVATQRPSVNVITGVIKANIPARIAYAVNSNTDSRVILDQHGAEKLVGKGDMLLLPGNSNVAQRIQGCFVSEDEVRKVVAHWRRQAPEVVYVSGVEGDDSAGSAGANSSFGGGGDDDDDGLMRQAIEMVVRSQLGSTSMLQRKLKVGFARAGRLMDLLEQRGIVGPSEGSKARAVLMTVEEFEQLREAGQI